MKAGAVAIIDQYFKQRTGTSVKIDQEAHICFSFEASNQASFRGLF